MQISSALLLNNQGHISTSLFSPASTFCAVIYAMQPIYHSLSLLNETANLKKKGWFEGPLPPCAWVPFRGQWLPWPRLMQKKPTKDRLQKISTPLRLRKGQGAVGGRGWGTRVKSAGNHSCPSGLPEHFRCKSSPDSPSLASQRLRTARRRAAKNFLVSVQAAFQNYLGILSFYSPRHFRLCHN